MKSITIHQTLHGYSDGHRLLDGSLKLADEVSRVVLRMSDLSGSNAAPGFEEYITGYPLEAMNLYALAKTWHAPEMPRPGCVWTHTLFIPNDCMSQIPDLLALTTLFRRPQGPTNVRGYSGDIQFEPLEDSISLKEKNGRTQIADLLETLYNQKKDSVLIGAQNSRSYESPIFRIWSQQWPQLRRVFTFCTGALSARGFNGKPFDIQCVPMSLVREIIAVTASKQSQELTGLIKSEEPRPAWLTLALEDALSNQGLAFRRMLWEFGDTPNRELFEPLSRLIVKLSELTESSLEEAIELVAEGFPESDSGTRLKQALFKHGDNESIVPHFDEGELLAAFARTPRHSAFSGEMLHLKRRASQLCLSDQQSASRTISQLFRSPVNPLGEDILAGLVEAINPVIARSVTIEQPQFLPTLFRAKPELGTSADLWIAGGDRKRELFEALVAHKELDHSLVEKIVQALAASDSEFLLRRALEIWGKPAVFGIFDMVASGRLTLTENVRGALIFHTPSIVQWLLTHESCSLETTVKAAHVVAPCSDQIRHFRYDIWLNAFKDLLKQGDERETNYLAALLLALGFQNAPPDALALVELTFNRIHQVAWDDKIPDHTWLILEPLVPHLFWLHDWDKCERLRRGLVEAFVKFRWPVIKLADCVKGEFFLQKVVDSARHVDGGRELLSQNF